MKLKKFFAANLFLMGLVFTSTFAISKDTKSTDVTETKEENGFTKFLNDGIQVLESVKDKSLEVVDDITSAVNSLTTKIPAGNWEFVNGKHSTTISCDKNGNMTIVQTEVTGETIYTGTFKATTNKITFNVTKKSSKVWFVTTDKKISETWTINYSIPFSKEMKITSDDLPNDANGFDFSRPAIFTEVKN